MSNSIKILTVRFSKFDQYANPVFISSMGNPEELASYNILKKYHQKLVDKEYDTFLPIFHSEEHEYATIRLKKSIKFTKMKPGNVYEIKYSIKTVSKDSRIFVNCFLSGLKLVKKAPVVDEGEDMDLDD
jgi:hypothetical protein